MRSRVISLSALYCGSPEARDEGADQAAARQVDALAERAAEHGEADALAALLEARDEAVAVGFEHAARLRPHRHAGVPRREGGARALQVVEAAEEGQVVAGHALELGADDARHVAERSGAIAKARGDIHRHFHAQLLAAERRGHVEQRGVRRQAERIAVEREGRERAREAGDRHRIREPAFQERRGHEVADGQGAVLLREAERALEHRVIVEHLGEPGEVQRIEEEALQRTLRRLGLGGEVLGHGRVGGLQRAHEALGNLVGGFVVVGLRLLHGVPLAKEPRERAAHRCGRDAVRLFERPALQLRGVHAACALQQVVRFVHEHGDAPAGVLHGGEEEGAAVEVVVVVAHDHVAPVGHFLREEIGAHRVLQRDLPQRLPVEPAGLCGFARAAGRRS
jgi:hypothetical protein